MSAYCFYKVENLDKQLDLATQTFLESETVFDDTNKVIHTTALFKWFLADFGGLKGIKEIYKNQLGKNIFDYAIKYKAYSWDEDLENFAE